MYTAARASPLMHTAVKENQVHEQPGPGPSCTPQSCTPQPGPGPSCTPHSKKIKCTSSEQVLLSPLMQCSVRRVGQNHKYTVYKRNYWQRNHQIYCHVRCCIQFWPTLRKHHLASQHSLWNASFTFIVKEVERMSCHALTRGL